MGGRRRAYGRPAGFIRRSVLRPIGLVLVAYLLYGVVVALLSWKFLRFREHVTPLWQLLLLGPLVLVVALSRNRPLVKRVRAWWDGRTGEVKVARILEPLLVAGYEVLHDLDIGKGNVDHVVVGRNGVFAVETKAWRGRVHLARGGRLMCKGFDKDEARKQAQACAIAIRARLGGTSAPYVTAVIALTRTRLRLGPMDLRSVAVLEAKTLPQWILSRPSRLERHDIDRIRDALVPLTSHRSR
jgi:hypothetical protein